MPWRVTESMGSSLQSWLIMVQGEIGRSSRGFEIGPGMGIGLGDGVREEGTYVKVQGLKMRLA